MSATQDKSQKSIFVYSNLYHLYRKGKDAAKGAPSDPIAVVAKNHVLKSEIALEPQIQPETQPQVRIEEHKPAEFIGKRVAKPEALKQAQRQPLSNPAIQSLKANLKSLNDLHARLRFMLQELEELTKKP